MSRTPTIIDNALEVAEEYPVFACDEEKAPIVAGGFKAATQDPDEIVKMFSRRNAALIGVPTGKASGLAVIDVDVKDGKRGKEWVEKHAELLGITLKAETPSGGWHYYYKHQEGLRNSAGIDGCIDIRAEGGYVCFPDNVNYRFLNDEEPADWPAGFGEHKTSPSPPPSPAMTRFGRLTDGREAKMAEMVCAKVTEAVAEYGADVNPQIIIDQYPDYERQVATRDGRTLEQDNRGITEWTRKVKSTLAKARRGALEIQPPLAQPDAYAYDPQADMVIRVRDGKMFRKQPWQDMTGLKLREEIAAGRIPIVQGVSFLPCFNDRLVLVNGELHYNMHPLCPIPNASPNFAGHEAVEIVSNHIRWQFPDDADYVIQWLAHNVQHYGTKIRYALTVIGIEGDGKTTIFDRLMRAVLGYSHVKSIGSADISKEWNDWILNTGYIVGEEITMQGENKIKALERLKPLITNDEISVNQKNRDTRQAANNATFVILSNHINALPISASDRRFHVIKTHAETKADLPPPEHFDQLHHVITNHGDILRGWLLSIDLTGFLINRPPAATEAKEKMRRNQLTEFQARVMHYINTEQAEYINERCFSARELNARMLELDNYRAPYKGYEAAMEQIGYVRFDDLKLDGKAHTIYVHRDVMADKPSPDRIRQMLRNRSGSLYDFDHDEF